jgi:hypothetical protein
MHNMEVRLYHLAERLVMAAEKAAGALDTMATVVVEARKEEQDRYADSGSFTDENKQENGEA